MDVPRATTGGAGTGPVDPTGVRELHVEPTTVERLVASQFPRWAALPVRAVRSVGTVNAVFRLGPELCVRLPRVPAWAESLDRELRWLPVLAPHLPLPVPEVVATGEPGCGYPLRWAVLRWIEGRTYDDALVDDEPAAARTLAGFVAAMRRIDATGAPVAGRRPLAELDAQTRAALRSVGDLLDLDAALAAWDRAVGGPGWSGTPVWIHGDLLRPNLLVRRGRLAAVLDFGGVGGGDPATDLLAGWSVFGPTGRAALRRALDADDATWTRARGIALHQAALLVRAYRGTNPGLTSLALRTIEQVVADTARVGRP